MKKLMYVFAILTATLWLNSSCSESDKKDEPEEPEVPVTPPAPPAPTTSDSLQGTWYGFYGEIQGTTPVGTVYELALPICNYDTITFSGSSVTQKWWIPTPTSAWKHKILRGTFSISNNILTNAMTSMDIWDNNNDQPDYNVVIAENHTYKLSFATNPTKAPYTKDTLTLVMTGATEITNNGFGPTMTIYPDANAEENPKLTLKFARKP
ncbi:MAG: hypothetical protein JXQ69_01575 [Paludibacteraceae bacterium]|nr:hypothetical protein [Paludibacteraceae bacterium]MBN2786987.1 hypothetical protein [Paludibacteraceae bacterium]